jgi:hypothetical protein
LGGTDFIISLVGITSDIDSKAFFLEALPNAALERLMIFHQQYTHQMKLQTKKELKAGKN